MDLPMSERLHTILRYLLPNHLTADIGGDHGYLLIQAAKKGILSKGIIGEINRGPWEAAKRHVKMFELDNQIEVRLGDGLSVLQNGEAEQICIAGMGGALISRILEEGKLKLGKIRRLVLQPNVGEHRVRQWLRENRFHIVDEQIVLDQEIYYEVIVAEPIIETDENNELSTARWDEIGPKLWEKRDPLFLAKRRTEQEQRKRVLQQLLAAKSPEAIARKKELEQEIKRWEKVLEEWQFKETI
ncbi:tRNA (adenine(22)-N(1))-methyltransferase [Risungbinella massiliensis]|uniref:tRNA (adenine(22)-N(1))-methyltransferase n=1 Tax=Risungbinella massiliensis TaxID=1329796 RepID=UPI0005CC2220|nr:class I SAM-dependent methyltransferase [Risungbinella massiliensis]